jgi:hypothetical protein
MNAMMGNDYRRSGRGGAEPAMTDHPPDPFEDVAAPPLRLVPSPRRLAEARAVMAVPVPAAQPAIAPLDDPADHPFVLADETPPEPDESEEGPVAAVQGPDEAALTAPAILAPVTKAAPRLAASPESSGLRQLRAAVLVGLLTAVAIVALAVAFRPPQLDGAATTDAVPTELGSGPVPAPSAQPEATTTAATAVQLRVDADLPEARRAALEAAIDAAGYGALEVAPSASRIDRGRIEYFHPADKAAAEALARSLAPLTGGPIAVHDLSTVTLDAQPGRVDVWVAD